ncbi:ArsI/CadI family heavy metal resistance metalloenzyme [Trujillonella endophytica]|uniref:Catechol 2,3-dioxygenase n=1 Tax=Trujillonella endophytica TaxID=673521 RepID=A0A1H8PY54_9ACTN|nr:ArsI/CadI family heavy metal resistance metalloenzyme [Trujillella endophytica]SEO46691.1 Catechol 2,3-dioxygenase [Trujillella endophytica]
MSRIQLALDVDDLEQAVGFYTRLLGVEPAKRRPGYANFAVAEPPLKLVLLENPGRGGALNHLGIELESSDQVHAEIDRLTGAGLLADPEMGTTCCYATQDKAWVTGPGGERWEVYTVLADSETFGRPPAEGESGTCCGQEVPATQAVTTQAATAQSAAPQAATAQAATACCTPAAATATAEVGAGTAG